MTTTDFKIWDEYNSTTGLGKTIIRHPYLSIAPKGKITFSVAATDGLKLTQDSRIVFVEGTEDGSFFICKTKDSGLMFCHNTKDIKRSTSICQLPFFVSTLQRSSALTSAYMYVSASILRPSQRSSKVCR